MLREHEKEEKRRRKKFTYQRLRENLASHVAGFDSTAGHRPRACALSQFLKKILPVAVVELAVAICLKSLLLHAVRRTWLSIASGNLDPRNEVELADERSYATIIPFELFFSNNQDSYKEVSVYIAGQRVTRYSSPRIIAPRLGLSVDIVYIS